MAVLLSAFRFALRCLQVASATSSVQLHLTVVIDPEFDEEVAALPVKKPTQWETERGAKVLLPYARICRAQNIPHCICSLKALNVGQALCEFVKNHHIERFFIGTRGRGASNPRALGSVCNHLSKYCSCTMVICRAPSALLLPDPDDQQSSDAGCGSHPMDIPDLIEPVTLPDTPLQPRVGLSMLARDTPSHDLISPS
jgi:nucleotide-binding universal stress UspA family protein